ncbi:MAG: hypothetical protein Kow0063_34060 [Anaerolineae bacterium]
MLKRTCMPPATCCAEVAQAGAGRYAASRYDAGLAASRYDADRYDAYHGYTLPSVRGKGSVSRM